MRKSNWIISPSRVEHKNYLKPPPSFFKDTNSFTQKTGKSTEPCLLDIQANAETEVNGGGKFLLVVQSNTPPQSRWDWMSRVNRPQYLFLEDQPSW